VLVSGHGNKYKGKEADIETEITQLRQRFILDVFGDKEEGILRKDWDKNVVMNASWLFNSEGIRHRMIATIE